MADTKQMMCLGCNIRPAVTGGPAPLCSFCSEIAEKNKRGVKFEKSTKKPDEPKPVLPA